jgi:hypothetical protein
MKSEDRSYASTVKPVSSIIFLGAKLCERVEDAIDTTVEGHQPREAEQSYNPPIMKTSISPYFWFLGRFKAFSTGIGRMMMAISEIMLNEALENQNAIKLTQ